LPSEVALHAVCRYQAPRSEVALRATGLWRCAASSDGVFWSCDAVYIFQKAKKVLLDLVLSAPRRGPTFFSFFVL